MTHNLFISAFLVQMHPSQYTFPLAPMQVSMTTPERHRLAQLEHTLRQARSLLEEGRMEELRSVLCL